MDPVRILLFIVITLLTGLLVVVGVQAFFILREFKTALGRFNKILEDAHSISSSVARPIVGASNFLEGIKSVKGLLDLMTDGRRGKSGGYEEGQMESPYEPHIQSLQEHGRRFFHKEGKPLS